MFTFAIPYPYLVLILGACLIIALGFLFGAGRGAAIATP